MKKTQITCDKCKKVVFGNYYGEKNGFKSVQIKLNDRNVTTYDLCPDCATKIGINKAPETKEEYESVAFSDDCIGDIDFDGCVADGQFWGEAIGYFDRGFKGISIEDIVEFNKLSKNEIDKMIDKQDFSDTVGRNLGGFIW